MSETSTLIAYEGKISHEELARVPTPAATTTYQPVPHHQIVEVLVESLGFRQIGVLQEECAVSTDGTKMFGVLDLEALLVPRMHSKSFSLADAISVGVDRMQTNFEPMRRQVETRRAQQLTSATAKLIIHRAFLEDELDAPKHLARRVHELYFAPQHEDFQPRTMWSLSNAFTSAFKELDPIPQFKATTKLGPYLERMLGS